jgi:hypothetical protein
MKEVPSRPAVLDALLNPEAYLHQARLLWLLSAGRPVLHDGSNKYIHTVTAQQAGGAIEMAVYFSGDPTPVDSSLIQLKTITNERDEDE